jgi:hypothetical protein
VWSNVRFLRCRWGKGKISVASAVGNRCKMEFIKRKGYRRSPMTLLSREWHFDDQVSWVQVRIADYRAQSWPFVRGEADNANVLSCFHSGNQQSQSPWRQKAADSRFRDVYVVVVDVECGRCSRSDRVDDAPCRLHICPNKSRRH